MQRCLNLALNEDTWMEVEEMYCQGGHLKGYFTLHPACWTCTEVLELDGTRDQVLVPLSLQVRAQAGRGRMGPASLVKPACRLSS